MERRLAAIMAADVVGYSSMMNEDGRRRMAKRSFLDSLGS